MTDLFVWTIEARFTLLYFWVKIFSKCHSLARGGVRKRFSVSSIYIWENELVTYILLQSFFHISFFSFWFKFGMVRFSMLIGSGIDKNSKVKLYGRDGWVKNVDRLYFLTKLTFPNLSLQHNVRGERFLYGLPLANVYS